MFNRLKEKWNVSGLSLLLIFCTFALGGSFCGYTTRKIMSLLPFNLIAARVVIYIILLSLLWPLFVLLISIPFGQFPFFRRYVYKMGQKIFRYRKMKDDQ